MHVLVADDDPVCRAFVEELVKAWGFTVSTAADGEEAILAVQGPTPPDVIVLDWMMPRLDGYEVCRRLKQTMERDIYVIMITGGCLKEHLKTAMVAGADDYIVKPFDGLDLQLHLRHAAIIISLKADNAELRARLACRPEPKAAASPALG